MVVFIPPLIREECRIDAYNKNWDRNERSNIMTIWSVCTVSVLISNVYDGGWVV